jgi:hypothetical protein
MAQPDRPLPARTLLAVLGVALILVVAFGIRQCAPGAAARDAVREAVAGRTTVTHALAVERVEAVAKLVSSETTVRDVVIYENTRFGATKKALVVVTGRIMAGFDLQRRGTRVEVDSVARRITITLPPPEVLAVEVTDYDTYDERSGLLNRFKPSDRDTIFRLARRQLAGLAERSAIVEHANRSARELLSTLFTADGYTTEVRIGLGDVVGPSR